jgi:shikimate dehydrogenase
LQENPELCGLNVTIPYKEQVLKFLTEIDTDAKKIGAVNVIQIRDGILKGYNTDSAAFLDTMKKWFPNATGSKALVLGTGGSSKAVQGALEKLQIPFETVSREQGKADHTYEDLEKKSKLISGANLIINTTPLGMSPNNNSVVPIDFELITPKHYIYDLIYNPARTLFLQKAEMRGANIKNGLEMLHMQAERAWAIWNN